MKRLVFAALAATALSMCVGCSQQNGFVERLEHPVLPSPEYTYSPAD